MQNEANFFYGAVIKLRQGAEELMSVVVLGLRDAVRSTEAEVQDWNWIRNGVRVLSDDGLVQIGSIGFVFMSKILCKRGFWIHVGNPVSP